MIAAITLRSTFITGFPGETEDEFKHLLDFIEEAQLDRVGVFAYSPVDGAVANALDNPVPEEVKEERRARLMELQEKISLSRNEAKLGKVMQVLVDETDEEGIVARSKADAPEIDGVVYLNGETSLKPGDLVDVVVEEADEYDLWGSLAD